MVLLLSVFFLGCATQNNVQVKKNEEPKWLINPIKEAKGKLTAVGCANKHYKGASAQKKLAIKRAIDEIAMQKSTQVNNSTYRKRVIKGNQQFSQLNSSSLQEVNNVNVRTKILEYYTKPNGMICVWVVEAL